MFYIRKNYYNFNHYLYITFTALKKKKRKTAFVNELFCFNCHDLPFFEILSSRQKLFGKAFTQFLKILLPLFFTYEPKKEDFHRSGTKLESVGIFPFIVFLSEPLKIKQRFWLIIICYRYHFFFSYYVNLKFSKSLHL